MRPNGTQHLCPVSTDEIRQRGCLLLPQAVYFPHHMEEEEEDEVEVVEEEEEEEAGSWGKTKLRLVGFVLCLSARGFVFFLLLARDVAPRHLAICQIASL